MPGDRLGLFIICHGDNGLSGAGLDSSLSDRADSDTSHIGRQLTAKSRNDSWASTGARSRGGSVDVISGGSLCVRGRLNVYDSTTRLYALAGKRRTIREIEIGELRPSQSRSASRRGLSRQFGASDSADSTPDRSTEVRMTLS